MMLKPELNLADCSESTKAIIRFISEQNDSPILTREFLTTLLVSEKVGLKVYDDLLRQLQNFLNF